MITGLTLVLIIILAIAAAGLLAASERTIVVIRGSRVRDLIVKGGRRAAFLHKLRSHPEKLFRFFRLSSMLVSGAAVVIAFGLGVEFVFPLIDDFVLPHISVWLKPAAMVLVVFLTAALLFGSAEFFISLIPSKKPESYSLWMSPPLWYLSTVLEPFITVIIWLTRLCLLPFGVSLKTDRRGPTAESEIRLILREGFEKGLFGENEKKMLRSIFEFSQTTVRRAMTPRTEIVAIDINDPVEKILKLVTEERFSRYPVYEDSIDNITGIIHSRDLLFVFTQKELFVLRDILRAAHFVPDSMPIAELMRAMKKSKFHMAIVLDEFGGTGGIITMEDVIEEIVGDIQDEYDLETSKIVFTKPGSARVKASMPIDEFANEFGVEVEGGEFDTVGGMIVTRLGRIPVKGEKIAFAGFTLEVIDKDGHIIKSVMAEIITIPE